MVRLAVFFITMLGLFTWHCSSENKENVEISDDIASEDNGKSDNNQGDEPGDEPGNGTDDPGNGTDDPGNGTDDPGNGTDDPPDDTDTPDDTAEPVMGGPGGDWVRHVINDEIGESIMFEFVPDLCGDGALKAIGSNHTNTADSPQTPESQVVMFDVPEDPDDMKQPWPMTKISQGIKSRQSPMGGPQGAPGIFGWGDADMDGDIDILVSGDGDAKVYVIEQTGPCTFETRILAKAMGQAGAMLVVDTDNDGVNELIVSSYEANVVRAYEWNSPASVDYDNYENNFDVHVISTRNTPAFATAGDVNDDGFLDLIVSHYAPMTNLQMNGKLIIYEGSGNLDNWNDVVINNSIKFPHKSSIRDVDGDGDMDIFHPHGFLACEANPMGGGACGGVGWYENTDSAWKKHQFFGPKYKLFFWRAVFDDYDHDGLVDFITVGERKPTTGAQTAKVMLFKGIADEPYFSSEPIEILEGLGSLPIGRDIDNDGDMDIFSAEYFLPAKTFGKFSFAWLEQLKFPAP